MRASATLVLSGITFILQATSTQVFADATETPVYYETRPEQEAQKESPPAAPFISFTGKITRNKVRLRQQPSLDSPILKEMDQGEMLIVAGESEDFFAVHPPSETKAYIFRTFVLDNVVEGNRVNVRLEPDTDSPVIAQLNSGDRVDGSISPLNSKWIEIAMPDSARFYISKDYVEKIGDSALMATLEKRRDEVNRLLNSTYIVSQTEMQKPFPEIHLEGVYENYNKLINYYQDFPEQSAKARELLSLVQDNYLQKKVAYLERKAKSANESLDSKTSQMSEQMKAQQQRLTQLEEQLEREKAAKFASQNARYSEPGQPEMTQDTYGNLVNNKMNSWAPREEQIYLSWSREQNDGSEDEFYQEQIQQAVSINGIVEPYTRAVSNKPGDYILINQASHLPIAYLYSTRIDLQTYVGHEVTLLAVPRPNNHFAFPAYFILGAE